jgi:hypothetical protein
MHLPAPKSLTVMFGCVVWLLYRMDRYWPGAAQLLRNFIAECVPAIHIRKSNKFIDRSRFPQDLARTLLEFSAIGRGWGDEPPKAVPEHPWSVAIFSSRFPGIAAGGCHAGTCVMTAWSRVKPKTLADGTPSDIVTASNQNSPKP